MEVQSGGNETACIRGGVHFWSFLCVYILCPIEVITCVLCYQETWPSSIWLRIIHLHILVHVHVHCIRGPLDIMYIYMCVHHYSP